jgi:hypothetical protein
MNDETINEMKKRLDELYKWQVYLTQCHESRFFLVRWLRQPNTEVQFTISEIIRFEREKE